MSDEHHTPDVQAVLESPCVECGMSCRPGEFHPYIACLAFKACHDGATVRANLDVLPQAGPASLAEQEFWAALTARADGELRLLRELETQARAVLNYTQLSWPEVQPILSALGSLRAKGQPSTRLRKL